MSSFCVDPITGILTVSDDSGTQQYCPCPAAPVVVPDTVDPTDQAAVDAWIAANGNGINTQTYIFEGTGSTSDPDYTWMDVGGLIVNTEALSSSVTMVPNPDGTVDFTVDGVTCKVSAQNVELDHTLNGVVGFVTKDLKAGTDSVQAIANESEFLRVTLPPNAIVVDANTAVNTVSAQFPVPITMPQCPTRFKIRAVGGMRYIDGVTNRRAQVTLQVSFDGGATFGSVSGGEDSFATDPGSYNEIHYSDSGASPQLADAQVPIFQFMVTLNTLTGTTVLSNTSITLDIEFEKLVCKQL